MLVTVFARTLAAARAEATRWVAQHALDEADLLAMYALEDRALSPGVLWRKFNATTLRVEESLTAELAVVRVAFTARHPGIEYVDLFRDPPLNVTAEFMT